MTNYARMYRFGITPWERYATAAAASIAGMLDREETGRSRPLGRALDLGCGRGRSRAGRYRGPGLADEQDRAAVVPAAPAGLGRHCPARSRALRPAPDDAGDRGPLIGLDAQK
jgi:hypothetical protein